MPILKNGSEVSDIRLDRIQKFDEKSRAFPVRELTVGKKLRSYTWRCSEFLDQGHEGACVGFSITHELVGRPVIVNGLDAKFAREQIYWEAQKTDQWPGGAYPGAAPFYEGTSVLDGIKAAQRLGYIKEYRWAFSLDDLAMAVGHVGPAILGVDWYEGMFDTDATGMIRPTGGLAGGHAILCNGVNIKKKTFTLHNSWGKTWGIDGECKISWDDLWQLLKQGGEACIPVLRGR